VGKNIKTVMAFLNKIFFQFIFYIVVIFVITSCNNYVTPDELNEKDSLCTLKNTNEKFTGICKKFYSNDNLEFEKTYKNGLLHGKFIRYFDSGKIRNEVNFIDGKPQGFKQYSENGVVISEKFSLPNNKQLLVTYFDNGNKHIVLNYENDQQNGFSRQWNINGKIEFSCNYKNNLKDGLFISYYNNGQINSIGNFNSDKFDGKWLTFYENKNLYSVEYYNKGTKDGVWNYYYENKSKRTQIIFKNGLVKEDFEWNEYGKLINHFKAD